MSALLRMQHIDKSFGTNKVLIDAQLTVEAGEVHALLGENGAGKSTLMKILGGIYTKDAGEILIDGQEVLIGSVTDARRCGISIIHQELMLAQHMSIAENIFMGQELRTSAGLADLRRQEREAQEMLDRFGMPLKATTQLHRLSIAQQQMVEIVRATSFGAKIIVMDEPTSSLSEQEVVILFELIRRLRSEGVGIIYISHRLNELDEISDRITVLRDGAYVGTVVTKETERPRLISMMVGRELDSYYTKTDTATDEVVLEVGHLSDGGLAKDVSFTLHKGEILGFAGLVGAGRSETMKCLFGITQRRGGAVRLAGRDVRFSSPKQAMAAGIGFVTEDRKQEGLFLQQGVRFNTTITVLERFLAHLRHDRREEHRIAAESSEKMQVKITSLEQVASSLSGGNQQKVLIARWLLSSKHVLILDEPTRGVDVKTKAEIYHLINELAKQGLAIIMISSELPELINMSDRVVVLSGGVTTGTLQRDELSQEKIMTLATASFVS